MNTGSEFLEHVLEMLKPIGTVQARRMFGGYGLYQGGLFFGLIADDTLYLKTDASNRAQFESAGSELFQYSRRSKQTTLSYYRAPDEALESPQLMEPWARSAVASALRAQAGKVSTRPAPNPARRKHAVRSANRRARKR